MPIRDESQLLREIERLEPTPRYAQIVAHGEWERAIRLNLGTQAPGLAGLDLIAVDRSLAAEVFYELANGRFAFFGVRFTPSLRAVSSPQEFLDCFVGHTASIGRQSLSDASAQLGDVLNNDRKTFAMSRPESPELGVIDYWKTQRDAAAKHRSAA